MMSPRRCLAASVILVVALTQTGNTQAAGRNLLRDGPFEAVRGKRHAYWIIPKGWQGSIRAAMSASKGACPFRRRSRRWIRLPTLRVLEMSRRSVG